MENKFEDQERYDRAKKQVEEIKGFYGNLVSYAGTIVLLMVINLLTSPGYLWFLWPMLGWGVGVLIHAVKVFNLLPFFGKDWEERKLRKFMEQEEVKQNKKWNYKHIIK
ncbi:2TM domain-containing protein [Flavobacterium algicola]|nr:2TM domain-containing protein [Flavobacterium algicola]MCG9792421.1 2TM domain-containing protein [Flavobacterium algicola]